MPPCPDPAWRAAGARCPSHHSPAPHPGDMLTSVTYGPKERGRFGSGERSPLPTSPATA